jgi:thioesterase domain-containing protein
MARQLQAQGRSVALLVILDTYPMEQDVSAGRAGTAERAPDANPALTNPRERDYAETIMSLVEVASRYKRAEIAVSHEDLCRLQPEEQLAYFLDRLREVQVVPDDMDIAQARRHIQVYEAHGTCAQKYRPKPYAGRITLFCSEDAPEDAPLLWAPLSSEPIKVHPVAGDHYLMIAEPYVQSLAGQLQQCLDQADLRVDSR